jgi:hypothetical protein
MLEDMVIDLLNLYLYMYGTFLCEYLYDNIELQCLKIW